MSWQLASFALLGAALLGGFAWYERSRPPAKVLALVAALAALAVVGRIAFAPIPNVKPTTDVVLFAGYALGGAAGFAVGAVTALASNVFFSHGPWTPWQMAAWGGVGAAAGGLARLLGGRELGRWPLALCCGVAGLGFGAVLDAYQWTLAARQDLASYIAVAGSSLPYNLAHAGGNVVFALLIGPPFVRALRRYRRRLEFRWRTAEPAPRSIASAAPPAALLAAALVLLAALAVPAAAAAPASQRAVRYLERAQNADGGFGGARGQSSSQLYSGWAALGLAAAGRNPLDVERGGRSAIDYIRSGARTLNDAGELERTILVLGAAGVSARRFAGRNLVAELVRHRRRNGSFDGLVNLTAFGVLALRATGERAGSARVRAAARWLERQQGRDGGFGFGPRGGGSDVDDTGAVLQALGAAGRARTATVRRAVGYLRRAQNADGGLGQTARGASNAQSTAWAVQGLAAAGRGAGRLRRGARSPLAYVRSLQGADGGVRYSRTSAQTPVWVTAQALAALERQPFPVPPVPRRRRARGGLGRAPPRPAKDPPPVLGVRPPARLQPAGCDATGVRLTAISPREASIFACLTDTVVAPEPVLPPVSETDAVAFFDRWLLRMPAPNRVALRTLLYGIELAPRLLGFDDRMRRLAAPERERYLRAVERIGPAWLRQLAHLVKEIAFLSYYGDDAVMRRIGYDAEANVRRGRELRAAEGRP